jgi:hypothetical protein
MAKVTAPALAFQDSFTMAMALAAPTVGLHTLDQPPQPVIMAVKIHARLVVLNPSEASS